MLFMPTIFQSMEHTLQDMEAEIARLKQQLAEKERELTMAQETIARQEHIIQEMEMQVPTIWISDLQSMSFDLTSTVLTLFMKV